MGIRPSLTPVCHKRLYKLNLSVLNQCLSQEARRTGDLHHYTVFEARGTLTFGNFQAVMNVLCLVINFFEIKYCMATIFHTAYQYAQLMQLSINNI